MSDKTMGEYPILDRYQDSWSGENTSDLVTFSSDAEESVFTQFLYDRVLTYFHYLVGDKMFKPVDTRPSSGLSRLTEYKDSRLAQFVRIFSGTAASLICLLPVVFLHLATAMRVRLGLLAAFSAIFSLALTLMTKASQAEIFAATAAYVNS